MSMIRQLRDLWDYQDRIKQLEACNLELARRADYLKGERNKARAERDQFKAERDAVVRQAEAAEQAALKINAKLLGDIDQFTAERDKLKADLGKSRGDLRAVESKRRATQIYLDETEAWNLRLRNRDLEFRQQLDKLEADLAAAEQLLDEAGESIRIWRNRAFETIAKLFAERHCR